MPDKQVSVGVSRYNIPGVSEGDGGDVLWPLAVLKDAHAFGQHAAVVAPEGDVVLAAGDDGAAVHRGKVHGENLVR